MESRNNIVSELQSISSLVAEIVPVTPYHVPKGYFENLASQMLELVKDEADSPVLMGGSLNVYTVPDNYFENLPEQILARVKNEPVSSILESATNNPYSVPNEYFEGLADKILSRVKALESDSAKEELESLSPLLSKLDKKVPFSIPSGYFDELTDNVVSGTKAIALVNEELENLSPLMSSLKTENVYEVPVQYFESLPATILSKVKEQRPAKVVSMNFRRNLMRYAAAAVIAGIIVTAGFLFMNRQSSSDFPDSVVLADEKIQQEALNNVKGLSDDEIVNFLETLSAPLDFLSMASSPEINADDMKLMLADIPDAELTQYLAEYGDAKEALNN